MLNSMNGILENDKLNNGYLMPGTANVEKHGQFINVERFQLDLMGLTPSMAAAGIQLHV